MNLKSLHHFKFSQDISKATKAANANKPGKSATGAAPAGKKNKKPKGNKAAGQTNNNVSTPNKNVKKNKNKLDKSTKNAAITIGKTQSNRQADFNQKR